MRASKKILIPILATLLLLGGFLWTLRYISQNDYIFKVNGQKVTMSEFNPYFVLQKKNMEEAYGENVWNMLIKEAPAIETARNDAKGIVVDNIVKLQQAKSRNISLTAEEKEAIRQEIELYVDEEALAAWGITKEEYIKIYEDTLIWDKLAVALYQEGAHSEHEHGKIDIESYLKGVESPKATTFSSRHILFEINEDMTDKEKANVKATAETVLKRLKNGEDFATLAKEFSVDPGSKENGGLYENVVKGSFVPEYEDAVFSIKQGELYPELVESSYGYHIIKCEEINLNEGYVGNSEAAYLLGHILESEAATWVEEAKIEINQQQYNSAQ